MLNVLNTLLSQGFLLPSAPFPTIPYDVPLKRLALAHRSWLELREYQLPYTITLANVFFVDLDTTIQAPAFYQYRTVPHYSNLDTRPDLLVEHTSLAFEQSDQIRQVPAPEVSFHTIKNLEE
jgi:hypothetical protein